MYGSPGPEVLDAYRVTARGVRLAQERDEYVATEASRIAKMLRTTPFAAVPAVWSVAKEVPVSFELVAWVNATSADPEPTLGEAVFLERARERLIDRFAAEYAETRADIRPSAWGGA